MNPNFDLRDPGARAALVLVVAATAGFVAVGLAWRGLAAKQYVALQLPYVASGVIGGLALAGAALGFLTIHLDRRTAGTERLAFDDVVHDLTDLAEHLRARG